MNGLSDMASLDNRVNSSNDSSRANQPGPLPSTYGYRHFGNNQEAHSFVNSVLNGGSGHVGTIAGARNLTASGPSNALSPFNGANGRITRFNNDVEARSLLSITGPNSFTTMGRSVGLHGTMLNALNRPVPPSCLLLLATIDTPIRSPGPTTSIFRNRSINSSPTESISSMNSFGSISSSPCECPNCSGCLCHMYCGHHAARMCPVHGLGLGSSEDESESGIGGSPNMPVVSPQGPRYGGNFF